MADDYEGFLRNAAKPPQIHWLAHYFAEQRREDNEDRRHKEWLRQLRHDEWRRRTSVVRANQPRTLESVAEVSRPKADQPNPIGPDEVAVRLETAIAKGVERAIASVITRRDDGTAVPPRLPTLKPWAWEAWRSNQAGMTLTKIAATLAEKYHDPKITQPRVTEQIQRAKVHANASGLTELAAKALPPIATRAPARTLDPAAAEEGERADGRAKHLREKARQIAKEE